MWKRLRDNLESGIDKTRWFSTLLNERVRIEVSLIRLLYQTSEMEKKRGELMKSIGERLFELKNMNDRSVLRDPVILDAFSKIEALDMETEELKVRVSELGRTEA